MVETVSFSHELERLPVRKSAITATILRGFLRGLPQSIHSKA
jgi:hypothetical protein